MSEHPDLSWLRGQPWALGLDSLGAYVRAPGVAAQSSDLMAAGPPRGTETSARSAVAVVPIFGFLSRRPSLFSELFGGTSLVEISQALETAAADPAVKHIILDVDSPGGSVGGLHELWARLREIGARRPITAFVSGCAASGAYWLASAAESIVCTPSGEAGSIGVLGIHEDWSSYWSSKGVTHTVISAGQFKAEGVDVRPLTDEAKIALQRRVDQHYATFSGDVAAGRATSPAAVRDGYGQGRLLTSADARAAHLVDRIETPSAFLEDLGRRSELRAATRVLQAAGGLAAADRGRAAAVAALVADLQGGA